jgi:membrane glycosyltransferase
MSQSYENVGPSTGTAPLILTTPTGVQSMAVLRRRRAVIIALNVITYAALLLGVSRVLSAGGWTIVDIVLMAAFAVGSPWTVLGFWNAIVGLWLLHCVKDPLAEVAPFAAAGRSAAPLSVDAAVLMTLRNEDPARAIARLKIVKDSIDATGHGARFSYFILSDSDKAGIAAAEEAAVAAWRDALGEAARARIIYRRRGENTGFKAGNVRDFCDRWGHRFELMVPLDADSLMAGPAIVEMVRMAEAHPRLGIIQSLVVGLPSASTFARIFQFGMRHGMRSYTMGQAWWTADCGPFWGHNAVVRIRPFIEACVLPVLPGEPPLGGQVMSHDQVEAALMRRAGYEVRVLPYEYGSWEENPPTMLDFLVRDTRWCQGNMQYVKLLDLPGLFPMSRFQLIWAVAMFVGLPAWTLMIALLPVAAWQAQGVAGFPALLAASLYVIFFAMYLMPKLAGLADVVMTTGGVARYGGGVRFALSAVIEVAFSFLQGAVSTIRTTIFMIGLLFGKRVVWSGQSRDAYGIPLATAARALWPQTLFGIAVCGALLAVAPAVFWWSLPLTLGYLLAIPFAIVTADRRVGRWFKRVGLCAIPEDIAPPDDVRRVMEAAS